VEKPNRDTARTPSTDMDRWAEIILSPRHERVTLWPAKGGPVVTRETLPSGDRG
jgi:hypothetical protein